MWAASVEAKVIAPLATLTGECYTGHLQYNQLSSNPTVAQLIKIGKRRNANKPVSIRSSVVNNHIIFQDNEDDDGQFKAEVVSYMIFVRPSKSIENDVSLTYDLSLDLKYNYVYWTDASNTFARGLGRHVSPHPGGDVA